MKELLLVSGDFVKTGGMDRANFALAKYLAKNGYSVHLVSHRVDSDLLNYSNIVFHRARKPLNSYLLGEFFLGHLGCKVANNIIKLKGTVVVNGGNCNFNDVNWVHFIHAASKAYLPSNCLFRLKWFFEYIIALRQEEKIIRQAKLVFATCKKMKKDLIQFLNIPENKIKVVYYGINAELFKPMLFNMRRETRRIYGLPTDRPLAMFIGALGDRRKGFDIIFSAWDRLCKERDWDMDLIVIGRGSELPFWKRKSTRLGLDQRIKFLGFISEGLPSLLSSCDLFISPSRYEPYSMAAQEAFCCGVPALVTDTCGISERYPEEIRDLIINGPLNVSSLILSLKNWRKRINYYKEAIIPFSEKLRSWSWDDMAGEMLSIIKNEN